MAIQLIGHKIGQGEAAVDAKGYTTYREWYLVDARSKNVGPGAVIYARNLPAWRQIGYREGTFLNPDAAVIGLTSRRQANSLTLYEVLVEWSDNPDQKNRSQNNPFAQPVKKDARSEKEPWTAWVDLDGKPFCYTNSERMTAPPPIQMSVRIVRFTRNEPAAFNYAAWINATNQDSFLGYDAGCVVCRDIDDTSATFKNAAGVDQEYWQITYVFACYPYDQTYHYEMDAGTYYWEPDLLNDGKITKHYSKDALGYAGADRCLLNGVDGGLLGGDPDAKPDPANAQFIKFRMRNQKPFGVFGIQT